MELALVEDLTSKKFKAFDRLSDKFGRTEIISVSGNPIVAYAYNEKEGILFYVSLMDKEDIPQETCDRRIITLLCTIVTKTNIPLTFASECDLNPFQLFELSVDFNGFTINQIKVGARKNSYFEIYVKSKKDVTQRFYKK